MTGAGRVRGVHSKCCSQSQTEAKFKLSLICQQGSKKGGGSSHYIIDWDPWQATGLGSVNPTR